MPVTLTQKEADMLINMLKKTAEDCIEFPSKKGRVEFDVTGERREDVFVVNIARKGINAGGASYQGRLRHSGTILLRLDVNPTSKHENPDGQIILGTHLHAYTEDYEMMYAVAFDVENKGLYAMCFEFFQRFNIIEPPEVTKQETLEGE